MHQYDPANPLSIFPRDQIANWNEQFNHCCNYACRPDIWPTTKHDRQLLAKMMRSYEILGWWWEPQQVSTHWLAHLLPEQPETAIWIEVAPDVPDI